MQKDTRICIFLIIANNIINLVCHENYPQKYTIIFHFSSSDWHGMVSPLYTTLKDRGRVLMSVDKERWGRGGDTDDDEEEEEGGR